MGLINLLEPEETVGALWHRLITARTGLPAFPDEAVSLDRLRRRLGVFYHGLGGDPGVEIKPIIAETSRHRLNWRERLGNVETRIQRARLDGDNLYLPAELDNLPQRDLNSRLYFWLTAFAAFAGEDTPELCGDPLLDDWAGLEFAARNSARVLKNCPGLQDTYRQLCEAVLGLRPERKLPPAEQALERAVRALLGGAALRPPDERPEAAPPGYRPMLPVVLWGEILPRPERSKRDERAPETSTTPGGEQEEVERTIRARRKKSDQAERRDSLLLYPFSGLLSWLEMLNINRHVEDEDEDSARKALDDTDELELGDISKKPATRLKFDLDLAPEDVDLEHLSGTHVYPEWDYRERAYHQEHCRVLTRIAEEAPPGREWQPDETARRRIHAVRRRFEALRPKRVTLHRQMDGNEFDMDALVRSRCDLAAAGEGSDSIFMQTREQARDLGVAVLIDTSRSTESWVEGRAVIDVEREALAALTLGLTASGDDHAIFAFSSLRRDRVYLSTVKQFEESSGPRVLSRIGALRPGFYTRLGAAIRHLSGILEQRPNQRRLLLVITDGKPNDLDHYEGRYGLEDTRMAVMEARRLGHAVFGVTIDAKAQGYFPHVFGRNGYAIVSHPDRLTQALPLLFQHLVN
ncbi:MAG: hypothetical protein C0605_02765 [Hyphomicrobiales bacterium]|nr:MAG: hypothetical protein C0605_02765 [Hyphomicrobiales bacterium]